MCSSRPDSGCECGRCDHWSWSALLACDAPDAMAAAAPNLRTRRPPARARETLGNKIQAQLLRWHTAFGTRPVAGWHRSFATPHGYRTRAHIDNRKPSHEQKPCGPREFKNARLDCGCSMCMCRRCPRVCTWHRSAAGNLATNTNPVAHMSARMRC